MPMGVSHSASLAGVLEEAEFYNITSLIKLVKDKIQERESKTTQVSWAAGLTDCGSWDLGSVRVPEVRVQHRPLTGAPGPLK